MIRKHQISFANAFRGLKWALFTQPNYQIHIGLSLLSLIGGLFFHISSVELLTILTFISIGLTIETINTAIEVTNDAIDTKLRPDIGLAKDISAGAMLIFAFGALITAGYIFIPKIIVVFGF